MLSTLRTRAGKRNRTMHRFRTSFNFLLLLERISQKLDPGWDRKLHRAARVSTLRTGPVALAGIAAGDVSTSE